MLRAGRGKGPQAPRPPDMKVFQPRLFIPARQSGSKRLRPEVLRKACLARHTQDTCGQKNGPSPGEGPCSWL